MADSFQKEIPKARINLSLDVETGGAKKKMELPLKLLVVGDFSNGKSTERMADRKKIAVNKRNFKAIMEETAPSTRCTVPNLIQNDGSDIQIDLTFDSLNAFRPEQVAEAVPELHSMMAMRNLLKDLKSNLLDNTRFRKELEKIVGSRPELDGLRAELESIVSGNPPTTPPESTS